MSFQSKQKIEKKSRFDRTELKLALSEDRSKAHAQYFVIVFVRNTAKSTHATFIITDKLRAKSADTFLANTVTVFIKYHQKYRRPFFHKIHKNIYIHFH